MNPGFKNAFLGMTKKWPSLELATSDGLNAMSYVRK